MQKKGEMKVLLVGASGFLGKNIFYSLQKNYDLTLLVRKIDPNIELNNQITYDKISSISNINFEVIINCAVNYGRENLSNVIDSNVLLPIKLIEIFKNSISIFITFDSFYTKFEKSPLLNYTLSKRQINNWYSKITNLRIVNIKLEHLYGKFDSKTKFIPWLIGELEMNKTLELTECKQKRDFISTFDVVSFIHEIIKKRKSFKIKLNQIELGTGKSLEIKKLVLKLKTLIKSDSKVLFNTKVDSSEIMDSYANIKTIPSFIEWKPKFNIDLGLKELLKSNLQK